MMLAGSFGLVRAWAGKREEWSEEIDRALSAGGADGASDAHHSHG